MKKLPQTALKMALLLVANPLHGQATLYEGFDYDAGTGIVGQGGSVDGWGGNWILAGGSNPPSTVGGQIFSSLEVVGGAGQRPVRSGNGAISRLISAASRSTLMGDGTTTWFSVLMTPTGGDGFPVNSFGTLILGDTALTGGDGGAAAPIGANGNALGVSFAGAPTGSGFENMRIQGVSYQNGSLTEEDVTPVGAGTSLVVGKVDWAANGTADVLNLYLVSDPEAPLGAPFSTVEVDLDQSNFNLVSIGDSQTSIFDEIRFGLTMEDVLPISDDTPPPPPPTSDGPNVIYILVDDMGYSDLGCYGGEIETPNIDSIAAEGIKFRQYYNNAKCEPTRTSIMTGLYHGRGSNTSGGATLAEALKTVNYRTYAVGKWHLGSGANIPIRQGFDNFYGIYGGFSNYFPAGLGTSTIKRDAAESGNFVSAYPDSSFNTSTGTLSSQNSFPADYYMTDGLGDSAVAFIQDAVSNHGDNPFFMYLAFNAPHTPLQAPSALVDKYRNNGTYDAGWDQLREEKWERQKALGLVDPEWQLPHLRDDIPRWADLTEAEQEREIHRRSVYAAMMDSIDQNVGKVLQQLAASGIADDTLIIFTGDNGAQAFDNTSNRTQSPSDEDSKWSMGPAWAAVSNTPFRYYKQSQHQGGICTPFVARWPGTIAPETLTDQPGHIVDVMATLVDISGADYDSLTKDNGQPVPPMDGASLLPIFEGETRPAPDFWGFEFDGSEFGVIQGDWKLAAFSSSPWRLYNLKNDRTETRNLRWENPTKVAELAVLYDQWAVDTYGDSSRTYAARDTRSQLSQELRYTKVLGGGIFKQPGIDITLSNIGNGAGASMNDHWEFYLTATSASGVSEDSDSVTFANKSFCGDGYVSAQVEVFSNLAADGVAGVMIRESLDAGSAFLQLGLKANGELMQSVRNATGENEDSTVLATGLSAPLFVKIERDGNQIISSYSADEATWTAFTPVTLNLGINVFAGLAASSGDNSTRASITFREWETRHIGTYPLSLRSVDGLSEYLAYALGAGPQTSALGALPEIRAFNSDGSLFPELQYSRRLGLDPTAFLIRYLGDDLSLWEDSTSEWTPVTTTPNSDGMSESILLRRNNEIEDEEAAFYSLEVVVK